MSTSLSTPAPTATPASAPSSGTYNIYARGLGVFLEFADGNEGTNLTTWKAAGGNASQQWLVTGSPSTSYTFRNVSYGTYFFYLSSARYFTAGQTLYNWYIEAFQGGFIFAPDPSFNSFWNVENGFVVNNNPIILYPGGNIWIFNPVESNQTSSVITSTTSSSLAITRTLGPITTANTHSGLSYSDSVTLGTSITFGTLGLLLAFLSLHYAIMKRFPPWRKKDDELQHTDSDF